MSTTYLWRGDLDDGEVNALHADAFETPVPTDDQWNWHSLLARHSLGWVTARDKDRLVGFVNVIWDGKLHAWLQDTMVASDSRGRGIGRKVVGLARDEATRAGCKWLHVDFDSHLGPFYYQACGFTPAAAGLHHLT
jgi:GNAT superfamily N-acetyltransferase